MAERSKALVDPTSIQEGCAGSNPAPVKFFLTPYQKKIFVTQKKGRKEKAIGLFSN